MFFLFLTSSAVISGVRINVWIGLFFLFMLPMVVTGQVITGNVIDGLDRSFLKDVWVINIHNSDSSQTNERGYFRVKGQEGDTIIFTRSYYITKIVKIGEDKHILTDIFMDARTLPQFDLYGERMVIPFRVGNQSTMRSLSDRPAGPGKVYLGTSEGGGLNPGFTIDGPISYFMKSERQKRQYAKKLAFMARQQDYLELIQSDSVMQAIKLQYNLTDKDLDDLIIEFNIANADHQFVDMEWEAVEKLLTNFLNQRTRYYREEPMNTDPSLRNREKLREWKD